MEMRLGMLNRGVVCAMMLPLDQLGRCYCAYGSDTITQAVKETASVRPLTTTFTYYTTPRHIGTEGRYRPLDLHRQSMIRVGSIELHNYVSYNSTSDHVSTIDCNFLLRRHRATCAHDKKQ